MNFHPACELFPAIGNNELSTLAADIKKNGQLVPILTLDGAILDGRNRYRACLMADVEPKFMDVREVTAFKKAGEDPVAFVVSLNLTRRHLSESERAMIASKVATLKDGQRKDLQGVQICPPKSIPEAAKLLNVSERSVKSARKVREEGVPELISAVEQGQIKVSKAAQIAELEPEEQRKEIEKPKEKKVQKSHRKPRGTDENWRKLWALAEEVKERAKEMETLRVDLMHVAPSRDLCLSLASRFTKIAQKLVEN